MLTAITAANLPAAAEAVEVDDILPWRDQYREEMNCQIIHDSLHSRADWTRPYLLKIGTAIVGYGSLAVSGPWLGRPTIFEFFVTPPHRHRIFDLFRTLLAASGAVGIETQSNDPMLTVMLHVFAGKVAVESIVFRDGMTTRHAARGDFRPKMPEDADPIRAAQLDDNADWVVVVEGQVVGTGGILLHYNRPYADLFMRVAETHRRRGIGMFLVQELKRVCYERGRVPAARCNLANLASQRTLQGAGFLPCATVLAGAVGV